jgi:hypothetical protein
VGGRVGSEFCGVGANESVARDVADEGGEDRSIATFGAFDGGTGRVTYV